MIFLSPRKGVRRKMIIPIKLYGYWRIQEKEEIPDIPDIPGVYCVYENIYNHLNDNVDIKRLLYIGGSSHIRGNIKIHLAYDNWLDRLDPKHELCFSVGYVHPEDYQRAENALIFEHRPSFNNKEDIVYPYSDTTISLSGDTCLLQKRFVVCQMDAEQAELDS